MSWKLIQENIRYERHTQDFLAWYTLLNCIEERTQELENTCYGMCLGEVR